MKRKTGIILLAVIISSFIYLSSYAEGEFGGGDGTAGNPYQISTAAHLNNIRNNMDKHFVQTADIDLNGISWVPIGNSTNSFTGSYDGKGFTISNVAINNPVSDHIGLFGYISSPAHLKNVKLINASVQGRKFIGSLVGWNERGRICNCSSTNGSVNGHSDAGGLVGVLYGGLIRDCFSTGNVSSNDANTGGLVGFSNRLQEDAIIQRSYSTANVSGGNSDIGGLVGDNSGIIRDSYATGTVTGGSYRGGLVGNNRTRTNYGGQIFNSYSISNSNVALVGRKENYNSAYTTVENSFWDTTVSGMDSSTDGGVGRPTIEMQNEATYTAAGWDFTNTWEINGGYPYLKKALTISGSFTVNDKVYDGNTSAAINSDNLELIGVKSGHDVVLNPVATFADISIGNGKVISLSSSTLSGADASKYILLSDCSPTATANILPPIATVTSTTYAVSAGGTANENITNVPYGTSKADFLSKLTKGDPNQTWDDTGLSDIVITGDILEVTAIDGVTKVSYDITVIMPAVENDLKVYWSFDNDLSPEIGDPGFNLSSSGNPTLGQHMGRNSVKFERDKSQYLSVVPGTNIIDLNSDFTYMAWYYVDESIEGNNRYFVLESTGYELYTLSYGLRYDSNMLKGQVYSEAGNNMYIGDASNEYGAGKGKWYNIIVTYDNSVPAHTAYINGVQAGTLNSKVNNIVQGLIIGSYRYKNGRFWDGYIDEVAIWNRVLTEEEIQYLQSVQITGENTYAVTYNGNGGTGGAVIDRSIYEEGTTITILGNTDNTDVTDDLVKNGYYLESWNTKADGTGTKYPIGYQFIRGTEDITLYAQWNAALYNITYNLGGGTNYEDAPQNYTIESETITLGTPTKQGFTFAGWYDDETYANQVTSISKGSTGNKTLYAKWSANTDTAYIVEHYKETVDGSGYILVETENMTGTTETLATAVSKTYQGYTEDTDHIGRIASGTILSDGSLILKLYYNRDTYTVSFNTDGGSAADSINNVRYEAEIAEPAIPIKEGYIFLGWYKEESLENAWDFESDKVLEDITLYAKWIDKDTIIMKATPDSVTGSINYNQIFTLEIYNDTVAGPVGASDISLGGAFAGLCIGTINNTGTIVTAEVYGNLYTEGIGAITLAGSKLVTSTDPIVAEVTVNLNSITYNGNESTEGSVPLDNSKYAQGANVTVIGNNGALKREGYTFTGWNTQADGKGICFAEDEVFAMGKENIILYAQWNIITHTVTFRDWDGTILREEILEYGETAIEPAAPTRKGYTFIGWDVDFANVKNDLIVTATYKTNSIDSSSDEETQKDIKEEITVIVNGQNQIAGTEVVMEESGEKVVELRIDSKTLDKKVDEVLEANNTSSSIEENLLEIPVLESGADQIKSILTGDIVKKMEQTNFTMSITTDKVDYIIPAREIKIEQVASILDIKAEYLKDIEVDIQIQKFNEAEIKELEKSIKAENCQMIVPPVEFTIVAKTTTDKAEVIETTVSEFSSYVSRIMEVPAEIDPSRITTGIVYNEDGTLSHIPTEVFVKDGKWYAKLNSLTNSSYSVIWNPVTVDSVENHWSKEQVNDMASRLVIKNPETFVPDDYITRGEFAEYITKALGIYRTGVAKSKKFTDVEISNEQADAIAIAVRYGIIDSYPDGTFRPNSVFTREEAMVMLAKAMDIVSLKKSDNKRIENYNDKSQVSQWTYDSVRKTFGAKVFNGKPDLIIDPKANFTHAEAITAIRNLLIESGLIG